jgi:hypothetical protein
MSQNLTMETRIMDKLCNNINYQQSNSGLSVKNSKLVDISGFETALETLVDTDNKESSGSGFVEYLTPIGMSQTKIVYENDYDYETFNISTIPLDLFACTEKSTNTCDTTQYLSAGEVIDSIEELSRVFKSIITQEISEIENWKFTYKDTSLGELNMMVKKVNHNNISVTMSTLGVNIEEEKLLIQKLHDRLLQKGWLSQISCADNNINKSLMWSENRRS